MTKESFTAYRIDGARADIVIKHNWEEHISNRKQMEDFCVRNNIIYPTDSCALSCIMAEINKGDFL